MGKKLTFFESLFLNKHDREMLLSSDDTINNIDDASDENINQDTQNNVKVILQKTTTLSNLDVDEFMEIENDDSLSLEEKELILFDTIENILDDDDVVVDEVIELSVEEQGDDLNSEDVDSTFELNILDVDNDLIDDLDDDLNISDTIIFKSGELNNIIENAEIAEDSELIQALKLAEDLEIADDLALVQDLELADDLEILEDLENSENSEIFETLKDLDALDADTDAVDIEFVSLDFGDDSFASLTDANSDSVFATIESGVIHVDLDDQLDADYSEDNSLINNIEILDEIEVDVIIEDDNSENDFPTLNVLSNETSDELSNSEKTDDSDNDEMNIPMI